ncbi:uncharacterized protein SPAPADRAFT_64619 [Spathaspora passalidarum NRRL Y-27907]|uniref:Uncharacterized protein n=1 Tax=Spathaspora passalidarum (strain NRRL Y-27907 / 11-Y1) TaxID=619300 RepID=G3AH77_SPAPN|nr:uncharacterized protein SPAPADRAFT_64619 [Spathaspora passalidarum NRRL Y-27907]EGW35506.1 hypothetical protein SPAPADRAFT_64619 [Spathaspora passalidarum NRRL Y-27907]
MLQIWSTHFSENFSFLLLSSFSKPGTMTLSIDNYIFEELEEMYNDAVAELLISYSEFLQLQHKQSFTLCKILFTNIKSRKKYFENKWILTQIHLFKKNAEVWEWRKVVNVILATMKDKGFISSRELRRLHSGLVREFKHVEEKFEAHRAKMLNENKDVAIVLSLLQEYPRVGKHLKQLEKSLLWRLRIMNREERRTF